MPNKKKALFLDRDGVINVDKNYVCAPSECEFVNGIHDVLRTAKNKGFFTVVVTNQAGIGRGYYTESDFHNFMAWVNDQLNHQLDAIYYCPYHEEYGIGKYKIKSYDRKPNPGMFLRALKDHDLDACKSTMIGDKETDVIAANAARISRSFLLTSEPVDILQPCEQISNLFEFIDHL